MSVTVTGEKELQRKLKMLGDQMTLAADEGVLVTANDLRTYAIKSIQQQSPGRVVTRSRQGGGVYPHVAAAEGEAPNTDTGKLVSSIAVEKSGNADYDVGTNLDYGEFLEMGTTKMRPRPWLIPAMKAVQNNMLKNIEKAADIRIRKLTK